LFHQGKEINQEKEMHSMIKPGGQPQRAIKGLANMMGKGNPEITAGILLAADE
jgi:hypothetical protein